MGGGGLACASRGPPMRGSLFPQLTSGGVVWAGDPTFSPPPGPPTSGFGRGRGRWVGTAGAAGPGPVAAKDSLATPRVARQPRLASEAARSRGLRELVGPAELFLPPCVTSPPLARALVPAPARLWGQWLKPLSRAWIQNESPGPNAASTRGAAHSTSCPGPCSCARQEARTGPGLPAVRPNLGGGLPKPMAHYSTTHLS